jgi:hypothetical protein
MSKESPDDVISDFPFSSDEGEKDEFTCPTCGKSFDTKRGKNIHMGQVHTK